MNKLNIFYYNIEEENCIIKKDSIINDIQIIYKPNSTYYFLKYMEKYRNIEGNEIFIIVNNSILLTYFITFYKKNIGNLINTFCIKYENIFIFNRSFLNILYSDIFIKNADNNLNNSIIEYLNKNHRHKIVNNQMYSYIDSKVYNKEKNQLHYILYGYYKNKNTKKKNDIEIIVVKDIDNIINNKSLLSERYIIIQFLDLISINDNSKLQKYIKILYNSYAFIETELNNYMYLRKKCKKVLNKIEIINKKIIDYNSYIIYKKIGLQIKNKLLTEKLKCSNLNYYDISSYIINLSYSIDRLYSIYNEIYPYFEKVEIFDAVNGENIYKIGEGYYIYEDYKILLPENKIIKKNEIGCLVSHILSIKMAWDNNDNICIIFEDDIKCERLINNKKNIIKNAPNDWEILQLTSSGFYYSEYIYNICIENINNGKEWIDWLEYFGEKHSFSGTGCYVINRLGMKKIVEKINNREIDLRSFSEIDKLISRKTNNNYNNVPISADYFLYLICKTYFSTCIPVYYNYKIESTIERKRDIDIEGIYNKTTVLHEKYKNMNIS